MLNSRGFFFDAFMAMPLYREALNGIRGRYFEDPRLPHKGLQELVPINVLLERLEPAARKTIESLKLRELYLMSHRNEQEFSLLPGIDLKARNTIRSVMKEYGYG